MHLGRRAVFGLLELIIALTLVLGPQAVHAKAVTSSELCAEVRCSADGRFAELISVTSIAGRRDELRAGAVYSGGRGMAAEVAPGLVCDIGFEAKVLHGGATRLPSEFTMSPSPGSPDRPLPAADGRSPQEPNAHGNNERFSSGASSVSHLPVGVRVVFAAAAAGVIVWMFVRILDGFH